MRGYRTAGYAVMNKFGERLCDCLTRNDCLNMIDRMNWKDTIIVQTLKISHAPIKRRVVVAMSPKKPPNTARQPTGKKRVYCLHRTGVEYYFENVKRAAAFFEVSENSVYKAIKVSRFIQAGPLKDWLLTRKEVIR